MPPPVQATAMGSVLAEGSVTDFHQIPVRTRS
jgi:hypothetical protein